MTSLRSAEDWRTARITSKLAIPHRASGKVGRSSASASRTLTIYELARLNYLAYAVGRPRPIPDQDLAEYERRQRENPRGDRRSQTGESPFWRYNKKLLARQLGLG